MSQDEENYTLDVDASNWAVGAVLQQEQEGLPRVIGYASKSFTAAEQRYCITRKELAGMIFGLKHYRQYLLGRQFPIRTDHAALSYLLTAKNPIGQQARWVDLMSEYTFTIQHRADTSHSNADALSPILPCEEEGDECTQFHKHIHGSFAAEDDGRGEEVICDRVRVLGLSQEEQMDTVSEPNLRSAKIEALPGTSDTPTDTEAAAFTLVDLQDILSPPDKLETQRGLSSGSPEEFIVLDDSEDTSYILCSQVSTKRLCVLPPLNKQTPSPKRNEPPPTHEAPGCPRTPRIRAETPSSTFETSQPGQSTRMEETEARTRETSDEVATAIVLTRMYVVVHTLWSIYSLD